MRPLDRKALRDLAENGLQFGAILAVVASGIAAYTAVSFSLKNLRLSRDVYYREARFADLEVRFDKAPEGIVRRARAIPGVRDARARLRFEVSVDVRGNPDPVSARVVSVPDGWGGSAASRGSGRRGAPGARRAILNDVVLMEGRPLAPERPEDVLVDPEFLAANGLRIGGRIEVTVQDRKRPLRIVGTARSPEFVYVVRSASEYLPDPRHFGIIFATRSFAQAAYGYEGAVNGLLIDLEDPAEIEAVVDRVEALVEPHGHLFTIRRKDQVSNAILRYELEGLEVSARVIPAVFLGVAAVVTHIMLARMIARQRGIIGVLKSFGYRARTILLHYVTMAMAVSASGAALGSVAGNILAGRMLATYARFYHFPRFVSRTYWDVNLAGVALAGLFAAVTGFLAARRVLALEPAEAMRPAVPEVGRRIDRLLPRSLVRRLSPRARLIARNLVRRPGRSAATALGLALSAAILVFAFFLNDSMNWLVGHEFREIQRYDLKVVFEEGRGHDAVRELARLPGVVRAEPIFEVPCRLRNGWREKELVISGLAPGERLRAVRDARGRDLRTVGPGLIIDRYLAGVLGLCVGDLVQVRPHFKGKETRALRIAALSVDLIWIPAYAELDRLGRLVDEPGAVSGAHLEVRRGERSRVERRLKDLAGVESVEATDRLITSFLETISGPLQFMTNMLGFFAAVIAFAVILNVTAVNVAERQRELATLRVLGFTRDEVLGLIRWETGLLAAAGIAIGVPLGHVISALVVRAYDSDLYRLPLVIEPRTYLQAAVLSAVFAAASALAIRRKVTGIDLVDALKLRD